MRAKLVLMHAPQALPSQNRRESPSTPLDGKYGACRVSSARRRMRETVFSANFNGSPRTREGFFRGVKRATQSSHNNDEFPFSGIIQSDSLRRAALTRWFSLSLRFLMT
jgi:hypothetical protein